MGERPFLRRNLNWYTLGIERRRKLKFGGVSLRICQNFSRENGAKNNQPEYRTFEMAVLVTFTNSSGDIFNRDMEFDLGDAYHVTRFRIDCRLADVMDHVTNAATLLVRFCSWY